MLDLSNKVLPFEYDGYFHGIFMTVAKYDKTIVTSNSEWINLIPNTNINELVRGFGGETIGQNKNEHIIIHFQKIMVKPTIIKLWNQHKNKHLNHFQLDGYTKNDWELLKVIKKDDKGYELNGEYKWTYNIWDEIAHKLNAKTFYSKLKITNLNTEQKKLHLKEIEIWGEVWFK